MNKIDSVSEEDWNLVNKENQNIVNEFLEQSTHLSPKSLEQYKSALRIYFKWIQENANNKAFYEIKPRDYLFYQNWLVKHGLSSAAVKMKRAAVSSLNGYVELYYEQEYPMFRNYISKKIASPAPSFVNKKDPPTLEEMEKIYSELEKKELWNVLAFVKFTFSTGCRRAEVAQLKREVINYEPKIKMVSFFEDGIKVTKEAKFYLTHEIRCKGRGVAGKVRVLQFDENTMIAIKKWLEIRGEDESEFVFPSKDDFSTHIDPKTFNAWAKRYIEPILGRRFHPHAFREARATTLALEEGKSIDSIQSLLGHNSSQTTQIYIIKDNSGDSDEIFT